MFIPVEVLDKDPDIIIINVSVIESLRRIDDDEWQVTTSDMSHEITAKSAANLLRMMRLINLKYGNEAADLLRGVSP